MNINLHSLHGYLSSELQIHTKLPMNFSPGCSLSISNLTGLNHKYWLLLCITLPSCKKIFFYPDSLSQKLHDLDYAFTSPHTHVIFILSSFSLVYIPWLTANAKTHPIPFHLNWNKIQISPPRGMIWPSPLLQPYLPTFFLLSILQAHHPTPFSVHRQY